MGAGLLRRASAPRMRRTTRLVEGRSERGAFIWGAHEAEARNSEAPRDQPLERYFIHARILEHAYIKPGFPVKRARRRTAQASREKLLGNGREQHSIHRQERAPGARAGGAIGPGGRGGRDHRISALFPGLAEPGGKLSLPGSGQPRNEPLLYTPAVPTRPSWRQGCILEGIEETTNTARCRWGWARTERRNDGVAIGQRRLRDSADPLGSAVSKGPYFKHSAATSFAQGGEEAL